MTNNENNTAIPTITHNNITFVDAQAMRLNHLKTFEALNKEELDSLKVGDYIKICVNDERFWVEVKAVIDDIILGRIDNELVRNFRIRYNDLIEIPKNCVYSIFR